MFGWVGGDLGGLGDVWVGWGMFGWVGGCCG